ncbi:MAG: 50S ribosomal protein L13, partial [Deltaproteobacteria bacterium]|nr:50S ribosomal protein L13 [Deltaproteobacteria bacterium]
MATKKTDSEEKVTKKAAAPKKATAPKEEAKAKTAKASTQEKAPKAASPKKEGPKAKRAPRMPQTYFATDSKLGEQWKLIDAAGIPLGRLSSHVANMLMGKTKPGYTRFADTGDNVVVVNAEKIRLTGKKWEQKTYYHHTQFPGGIKSKTAKEVLSSHPERLVQLAVYRMLPRGHMARKW